MTKIGYAPITLKYNAYAKQMVNALSDSCENASVSAPLSYKKVFFDFFKSREKKFDVLIINWLENRLRTKSGNFSILGFIKFIVVFLSYRLQCEKLIYVRHNIYPHNMKKGHSAIARFIVDCFADLSDVKVCHSGHMIKQGYEYIPHPLYDLSSKELGCNGKENDYFIVFGRVEQYKKIELLIDKWPQDHKLLIVGAGDDLEYIDFLRERAKHRNVVFRIEYVDEAEAESLVGGARGLILSHSDEDMIVSGSFFFAATLGVPILTVRSDFFSWLQSSLGFKGLFVYEDVHSLIESVNEFKCEESLRRRFAEQAVSKFGNKVVSQAWGELIKKTVL